MDAGMEKTMKYLTEVETVAQDILTTKEDKFALSDARNKFNEAFRALESCDEKTTYITLEQTMFEFPRTIAMDILKKDMESLSEEIERLRLLNKEKVRLLRDLEHEPKIVGIGLKPLSAAEANAIHKAFGY